MYSYEYDTVTGGVKLIPSLPLLSKEVRPVYYREMDILGFDKHFSYDKQDDAPYMWAEANIYFYKGRKIAATHGGTCYEAPVLEVYEGEGEHLDAVDIDAMVKVNSALLNDIEIDTMKRIYNTYTKYKERVDVFYVAFSGGKDSIVTLDMVQRALPHDAFKVVFGDTMMEFPDTYDTVNKVEEWCRNNGIDFLRAKSHMTPDESWHKFGPPASVLRWCCNVHKTVPQILLLRKVTGKPNFTGMAFIGVRASESLSRSKYTFLSRGEKHSGQYNFNPILKWNSAELYLYIYKNNLIINAAYKKGNRRVGCLVCPGGTEINNYWKSVCYRKEFDFYINIIKESYKKIFLNDSKMNEFVKKTGWRARRNNRDITLSLGYKQHDIEKKIIITVDHPTTSWQEWIKTLGELIFRGDSKYTVVFENVSYDFCVVENDKGYTVTFDENLERTAVRFIKYFKNIFRKSVACVMCKECVANCYNGFITMDNGVLKISSNCTHCLQCHEIEKGCIRFGSLKPINEGGRIVETETLNRYSNHGPKMEWIKQYFEYENDFDTNNTLGTEMAPNFKKMTIDAEIRDDTYFSYTARIIKKIGLENIVSWAIMFCNLCHTRQINWYVNNITMGSIITSNDLKEKLLASGAKNKFAIDAIYLALKRFLLLPFSKVGMGEVIKVRNEEGKMVDAVNRTPWAAPDARVILYSLYKYAEGCDDYRHFTLSRLYDRAIECKGVSPAIIFGTEQEEMKKILTKLAFEYPKFIKVAFTLGLDNIDLSDDKEYNSMRVLEECFKS